MKRKSTFVNIKVANREKEYIKGNFEDVLRSYITDEPTGNDEQEKLLYRIRCNRYESFCEQNLSVRESAPLKLTYDTLPELLDIAGISLKQAYQLIDIQIKWPDKQFEELADYLDELPAVYLPFVENIANSLANDFVKDEEIQNKQPSERIKMYYARLSQRNMRGKNGPESFLRSFNDKHSGTPIPFADLPELSCYFGISIHWMCRLPCSVLALAKRKETESIMDYYSFMSKENRNLFFYGVKALSQIGGDTLG